MAEPSASPDGINAFFSDPTFWVTVCLLVFAGIVAVLGVPRKIVASLDQRRKAINAELEQARRLREEAQEILARAEREQIEAQASIERILESAHAESRRITEAARKDLAESLRRRRVQAEQNIASAERQARQRLMEQLTDIACRAAGIAAEKSSDDSGLEKDIADASDLLRPDS